MHICRLETFALVSPRDCFPFYQQLVIVSPRFTDRDGLRTDMKAAVMCPIGYKPSSQRSSLKKRAIEFAAILCLDQLQRVLCCLAYKSRETSLS